MFRVEMAGLFVALMSLIRGAELPCKAYLLEPPGLSAGERSNVVVTRVLLDVAVLMPAALVGLPLYFGFPEAQGSNLVFVDLVATGTVAAVAFLVRRRVQGRAGKRIPHISGSGWQAKAGAKICGFLRDMHRSFAAHWRPGHRATVLYAIALTTVYLDTVPLRRPFGVDGGWVVRNWLPVVVEVDVELDGRPPEAVEAKAYFVVAEALTNVAKHSGASEARVSVWRVPNDGLVVEVVDDGKGGANPETGTGLAGLADRLTALDGQLFVESPAAGPSRVRVELPLGLAQNGSGSRGSSARKEGFEVLGVRCSSLDSPLPSLFALLEGVYENAVRCGRSNSQNRC